MTDPTPLSPAAQAVLDAYRSTHLSLNNLAAALRAVVGHCAPDDSDWVYIPDVLAIAAELDGTNPSESD